MGKLLEVTRTFGRHRRYVEEELLKLIYPEQEERINVGYARVSTHDQKKDLENQAEVLEGVCKKEKKSYKIIKDLGSGLNFKKKGLKELINLIIHGKISKIFITHKDRLLRFGTELVINIAKAFQTEA